MPVEPVPRVLEYVGVMLLLALASTFPWWAAANIMRAEYRRLLSALACSMRWFFYSICLLCILVALSAFNLAPEDPTDTLFGWIHLLGSVWITVPCAWRSFRSRGARLLGIVAIGLTLCAAAGWLVGLASGEFSAIVRDLPRYLTKA